MESKPMSPRDKTEAKGTVKGRNRTRAGHRIERHRLSSRDTRRALRDGAGRLPRARRRSSSFDSPREAHDDTPVAPRMATPVAPCRSHQSSAEGLSTTRSRSSTAILVRYCLHSRPVTMAGAPI